MRVLEILLNTPFKYPWNEPFAPKAELLNFPKPEEKPGGNSARTKDTLKAGDTLRFFVGRSPRTVKIARCARSADCGDRRIKLACKISAIKFAGIRLVRPFPRFSTLIAANRQ